MESQDVNPVWLPPAASPKGSHLARLGRLAGLAPAPDAKIEIGIGAAVRKGWALADYSRKERVSHGGHSVAGCVYSADGETALYGLRSAF